MEELFKVYFDPEEIGKDGYPLAWHRVPDPGLIESSDMSAKRLGIKHLVRMQAGHRCERCRHPYPPEILETCPRGEWTPCDELCTHQGPTHVSLAGDPFAEDLLDALLEEDDEGYVLNGELVRRGRGKYVITAHWRILTVHHLNGIKHDLRWWNLASLCQVCHLSVQGRVRMEQVYPYEHTEWFKPHAAGWYASAYLGEELTREETMERLDELLNLERGV